MNQVNGKTDETQAGQQDRRALLNSVGKFWIYTAPFTMMALNTKAATSSGSGPQQARPVPSGRH